MVANQGLHSTKGILVILFQFKIMFQ